MLAIIKILFDGCYAKEGFASSEAFLSWRFTNNIEVIVYICEKDR